MSEDVGTTLTPTKHTLVSLAGVLHLRTPREKNSNDLLRLVSIHNSSTIWKTLWLLIWRTNCGISAQYNDLLVILSACQRATALFPTALNAAPVTFDSSKMQQRWEQGAVQAGDLREDVILSPGDFCFIMWKGGETPHGVAFAGFSSEKGRKEGLGTREVSSVKSLWIRYVRTFFSSVGQLWRILASEVGSVNSAN